MPSSRAKAVGAIAGSAPPRPGPSAAALLHHPSAVELASGKRDVERSNSKSRGRWARRAALLTASLFALFVAYRVLFVYTFRPGTCPPGQRTGAVRGGSVQVRQGSPPAAERPGALELKVLSYNIGGHTALVRGRHVAAISELIALERPDVVGLQEVHRNTWQARFRDQAAEIASATGLDVAYGPSFRALGGEFGNAVLVRGAVLESEVVPLPSFGEPRSLLRARVDVDGLVVEVFVAHLTAWGGLNRRIRAAQARCLSDQVGGSGLPFVLVGDLNATPQTADLESLMTSSGLRLCGAADEATHSLLGRRLDYIFSDPRFELVASEVLRRGPSDHWPVMAKLRWPSTE